MSLREAELSRSQRSARTHAKQQKRKKKVRRSRPISPGIGHNLPPELLDDAVMTFAEWCRLNSLGQRTGRRLLASGNGPAVTMLTARRIGVTVANNRKWQESRVRA